MATIPVSTISINDSVLVYDRVREEKKQFFLKISRFVTFLIPLIIVWGILGVFAPVWVQEAKSFEPVFPKGMLTQYWQNRVPVWVNGYSLEIPKLSVQETVIEHVDPADKSGYMTALTHGVAHAEGSSLPGNPGTQYYFAHSSGLPFWGTRAVTFATLDKLVKGDEVLVYKDNKKYSYVVTNKSIVSPDDVTLLTSSGGSERVVLQTCWPLGTDWKRLLVIADKRI